MDMEKLRVQDLMQTDVKMVSKGMSLSKTFIAIFLTLKDTEDSQSPSAIDKDKKRCFAYRESQSPYKHVFTPKKCSLTEA